MKELQGTDLLYRRWDAEPSASETTGSSATTGLAAPKAVFVLVHGLGGHSARWDFLAGHLAGSGFASYAIELRGFGRTPERPRGHVDSFETWFRDILALREIAGRDFPGKKVFLLGESMGGLIAYDLAGRHPDRFAGVVLISPAFKNGMKFPLSAYLKLVLFGLFNPKLAVEVPFTSDMVTRDPGLPPVMDASRTRSGWPAWEFWSVSCRSRPGPVGWPGPPPSHRSSSSPAIDHLVDERAGRKIFEKFALADKTLIEYPDMLHALSIDLGTGEGLRGHRHLGLAESLT